MVSEQFFCKFTKNHEKYKYEKCMFLLALILKSDILTFVFISHKVNL